MSSAASSPICREILHLVRVPAIGGSEDLLEEVTVVHDGHSRSAEPVGEPGGPKRGRRLVLAGRIIPALLATPINAT
jgi:hypothetical protein